MGPSQEAPPPEPAVDGGPPAAGVVVAPGPAAGPPLLGAVVAGEDVVGVVVGAEPPAVVLVARTCVGEKEGRPPPELPVTLVPPKTHAVTPPGGGLYVMGPDSLYDQVVCPALACQYDQ